MAPNKTLHSVVIERLQLPARESEVLGLAGLLVGAVEAGAAVTFLGPLPLERAVEWWRKTMDGAQERAVFLVARDGDEIVGTVQVHPAWAPNQPHRAEVAKLMVHREYQGAGLGARLMERIEEEAGLGGFTLLTLDTREGDTAERLYRRLGWCEGGRIPEYALNQDGTKHGTVIFYKFVNASTEAGAR